ncbi:hypothetical protein ACFQ3Z_08525 [Streptomyces nogalater]
MLDLEAGLPEDGVDDILTGVVEKLVATGDLAAAEQITDWQGDDHAIGYLAAGAAATGTSPVPPRCWRRSAILSCVRRPPWPWSRRSAGRVPARRPAPWPVITRTV